MHNKEANVNKLQSLLCFAAAEKEYTWTGFEAVKPAPRPSRELQELKMAVNL